MCIQPGWQITSSSSSVILSHSGMAISQCTILMSRCSKSVKEEVKWCNHHHDHVAWQRNIPVLFQKCTWLWIQMVGKEINYICHVYLKCQRKAMEIHRTCINCSLYSWKMGSNNYLLGRSVFWTPRSLGLCRFLGLGGVFLFLNQWNRESLCSSLWSLKIFRITHLLSKQIKITICIRRFLPLIWLPFRFCVVTDFIQ